ncbi:MAG: hypothetical protein MJ148_04340 [Clostridia bacterium]|nr:hypothetical protein [Clostridia bacterium]
MDRKYRFADFTFVIALLLNFISMILLVENKVIWIILAFIAAALGGFIRRNYPVDLNGMLLLLDFSVAFAIIGCIYSEINEKSIEWLLPSFIGCMVSLLSILFMRINTKKAKGKLMSAIVFILVVCLSLLVFSFAANSAGNIVVKFFELVAEGAKALGRGIYNLMSWIVSLFPDSDDSIGIMPGSEEGPAMGDVVAAENPLGKLIVILIIAAVIVFIIIALFKMRHFDKPKYEKSEKARVSQKKSTRFGKALIRLWENFVHALRMGLYMMKGNELAKYYRLVFRKRFTKDRKLASETPREFINRVSMLSTGLSTGSDPIDNIDTSRVEALLYK